MKPQIVSCAMVALALSASAAWADDIKPVDGAAITTPIIALGGKIIGNGLMPDGRECFVGTTPDCVAKDAKVIAGVMLLGDGLMPEGGECIVGTTPKCAAKDANAIIQAIVEEVKPQETVATPK